MSRHTSKLGLVVDRRDGDELGQGGVLVPDVPANSRVRNGGHVQSKGHRRAPGQATAGGELVEGQP
jgi:hypothetical protein